MGTEVIIAAALAAAASGAQMYNTNRTASRQDAALADSIRGQSRKQQQADQRINEEVQRLEGSTAESEREKALTSYGDQLRRNTAGMASGLSDQTVGSETFRDYGKRAAGEAGDYANRAAGLMARMDAPAFQRQSEAFSRGHLGTDIGLLGRESQGQAFMDDLRLRAIRRSPWIDAGAQVAGSMAGNMGGGAGSQNSAVGPYASGYRYPGGP